MKHNDLTPGYYKSYAFGIIHIPKINIILGKLSGLLFWDKDQTYSNERNMTDPEWILEHTEKLDFSTIEKCPLCDGSGTIEKIIEIDCSCDPSVRYIEGHCTFCEEFEKIKKEERWSK